MSANFREISLIYVKRFILYLNGFIINLDARKAQKIVDFGREASLDGQPARQDAFSDGADKQDCTIVSMQEQKMTYLK